MVNDKDTQFCMENFKMKRRRTKEKFDLPEQGFEPKIFSNFHAYDSNFHRR